MSDYLHQKGYIYPITKEEYEKLDEKYFDLEAKGYDLEVFEGQKGLNRYLVFLTYHSYGKKHDNFGKGFKENDTRNSWVRDENHYVTRTIAALLKGATSPLQIYGQKITYVPIKFRYKKDTATLILYK